MRVAAIIAEYNPFHNGHAYHIRETRRITECDYLIVVMSGDYTQRGIPAFMPKHERAKIALSQGADLVIELPLTYATGTAERFAYGAVSLLNHLGCVDYLSFGCENDNLETLQEIADLLIDPPSQLTEQIDSFLKEGLSYPRARAMAVKSVMQSVKLHSFTSGSVERSVLTAHSMMEQSPTTLPADILESPNNILAVEYLKALKRQKSIISPVTVKRKGAGYHDTQPNSCGLSSASGIRSLFLAGSYPQVQGVHDGFDGLCPETPASPDSFEELCRQVPDFAFTEMKNQYKKTWPVTLDDFSHLICYSILTNMSKDNISIQDMSVDLWNRIRNNQEQFTQSSQFIASLNSKELTYARVARALLHLMLGTPDHFPDDCPYARVLGFRRKSSDLLSCIKQQSSIPFVTKLADAHSVLAPTAMDMLDHEIQSTRIYHSVITQKYGTHLPDEYRTVFPIV